MLRYLVLHLVRKEFDAAVAEMRQQFEQLAQHHANLAFQQGLATGQQLGRNEAFAAVHAEMCERFAIDVTQSDIERARAGLIH